MITIPPTLAIINAKIWTANPLQPWAEAVMVQDGTITAVGRTEEIRHYIGPGTKVLDLDGQLVIPGFIDNHTHFMTGGFYLLGVDLRACATPADFTGHIKEKAALTPPGIWLTGGNWDHEVWPAAQLPTKKLIDDVTPDNPVFVTRTDLHMGLANSAALKLAGITAATSDPVGGVIVRDETGEPTGILKDTAMDLVRNAIPAPTPHEYGRALDAAMAYAVSLGITSIQDVTSWDEWEIYRNYYGEGKLRVRVYGRTPITEWEKQRDMIAATGRGDCWLRLGGVKGFVDGSLGSSTALFFAPYADTPQTSGLLYEQMYPEGIMKRRIAAAAKAGLQPSVHAIGDKAVHILLDIYREVISETGLTDGRFRIEHAQHLLAEDMARFSGLGIIASVQPAHLLDDAGWAERRLGKERCLTTYSFRSLFDAGAKVTFGTDWPVADLNPLLGLYAAVTRRPSGDHPDGWMPQEKIGIHEAVLAYTLNSAYAEFAEQSKGAVAVGKLADMTVLSKNFFTEEPSELLNTKVLYTIIDGKIAFANE